MRQRALFVLPRAAQHRSVVTFDASTVVSPLLFFRPIQKTPPLNTVQNSRKSAVYSSEPRLYNKEMPAADYIKLAECEEAGAAKQKIRQPQKR
jgi:hypothetical protein